MPNTIKFSDNPNEETAFVTTEDDTRTRVVLTTPVDGTVKFPDNPNSTKVSVTVDGVARKAVAVYNLGGGGGGDQHNLGWYATESALTTAHATASDGDWAIVGSTDTVWVWDSDTTAWKDTDTKGQVTSVNGQTGDVTIDALPSQTGHSGEFLTTDGTDASWSDKPLVNNTTQLQGLAILGSVNAVAGTAIGYDANSSGASTAVGRTSSASGYGSAYGHTAKATGSYSVAAGYHSTATGESSVAIGGGNTSDFSKATATGAIQIGKGTNNNAGTLSIGNTNGNYEMMSADGTIPTARLTKVNTTITLAAAGWSSNTQTVSVTGMTATGVVMVSPAPTDQSAYTSAGILCTSQTTNSLTFTATTTPTSDIDVNIVCL